MTQYAIRHSPNAYYTKFTVYAITKKKTWYGKVVEERKSLEDFMEEEKAESYIAALMSIPEWRIVPPFKHISKDTSK